MATGVYRPTSVLAVTFTTRAAGELRGRLQRLGVGGVQARTFHSAALRQAQYFWPQAYGGELPRVLENKMSLVAESANRLRVQVDTPRLRDLVSEISWAKVSNVAPEDYARLAGPHHRSVSSMDPETVARVFESYEATKRDRDRIDFEDILLCAAALISEHPNVADQVRSTYRHFVVDEYQDVSPLQQALLDLWRGDRADLCVVGDPAQTIHSFAGARASYLTEFARRHRDSTVIRLVRDYRSTPQVVGVANQVMDSGVRSGTAVRLQAQQPAGPAVEYASAPDEQTEAGQIADWLSRLAQPNGGRPAVEFREMAVLFRINANSPALEQALADRQIPYLVRGGERFYERPEVRQALLTLRNAARANGADTSDGDVLAEVRAVLGSLGWTPQAPNSAGAVRERWESLAALVSVAEDLVAEAASTSGTLLDDNCSTTFSTTTCSTTTRPRPDGSTWPRSPPSWIGERRRSTCRPPRASRSARSMRPRAWSGTPSPSMARRRGRCRSCSPTARTSWPRNAGCCTSGSPGLAADCESPGRPPATAVARPGGPPGSWTVCCHLR